MQDVDKTKEELATEVAHLRQRIAALEQSEVERKQAEEALRESEATVRALLNTPVDVAALVDTKGIVLDINETMAQGFGRSVDELIGVHAWDLIPTGIAERRKSYFNKAVQSGEPIRFEDERGGVCFDNVFYPVRDEQGKVTKVALLARDITDRKKAEKALQESEGKWWSLAENLPDYIVNIKKDGTVIAINRTFPPHTKEQVIGTKIYDYVSSQYHNEMKSALKQVFQNGKLSSYTNSLKKPDGSTVWLECRIGPIFHDGHITGATLISTDITERKRAEEALLKSEEKYRVLFDAVPVGIGIADLEGTVYVGNQSAQEITGYTLEEFKTIKMGDMYVDPDEREQMLQVVCESGQVRDYEVRLKRKDGTVYPVLLNIDQIELEGRKAFLTVLRDITERKQAEEALRDSEERYRAIFEQSPFGVGISSLDGTVVASNKAMEGITGYSLEELKKINLADTYENKKGREALLKAISRYGNVVDFPARLKRKDGTVYDALLNISRINLGGKDFFHAICQDITERKRAEEALQESEKRYRNIFETIPVSIIVLDKDGQMVDINPYHLTQIAKGQTPKGDFIGKNIVTHPTIVKSGLSDMYKRVLEGGPFDRKDVYFPLLTTGADGYFNVRGVPLLKDDEVIGAVVIQEDITERKRVEKKLQESEEKFRLAFENANTGVCLVDLEGNLTRVNNRMCEIFGYTKEELESITVNDIAHPEDIDTSPTFIRKTLKGEIDRGTFEKRYFHKKGHVIVCQVSSSLVRDSEGSPLYFISHVNEITERKQAEEALQESEGRYRTLVDNIDLGINLIDANHNVLMANAFMGKSFNKPVSVLIGKKCFREFEKRDAVCAHCPGVQAMATGKPAEVETKGVRDDGSRFDVRLQAFPVTGQDGTTTAFIEIAEDITERKQAEQALRESEEKYRSLVQSSADSIYLVDRDCTYLFMNKKHRSRLGLKSSNVVGRAYREFHSPEEKKDFAQKIEKVCKTGTSLSYEYRSQRDKRYFIRTLSPVKASEGGKPSVVTVISKDITEIKQAGEALREREAFNFALFHYNPVETIVVDRDGSVIGFNLAKEKSGDRLPAIGDVMYKDYAGKHEIDMRAELMACIKSGKVEAFPERRYGDKYLSITISPFSQGALIISEDITERKRAAELLHRERDTFLSVLKKAPYGVVLIDKDEKGILCNSEFTNITGYTLKDVATIKDWLRLAYPDKKYRDIVIHTLRGDKVEADSAKLYQNKFQRAFFRTFTVTCKDGTVKEIEFRPTVLEDGSTIIMFADITEKKRMHDLLEAAATEWRATFDAIGDAVCLLDQQGRIKRCNNAMLGMLERPFSEIVDLTCWEILHGVSRLPKEYPIARMQKTLRRETDVFLKDNHWFNVSVDPLLDGEGNVVGAVHIMSDITDRMLAAEELQNSREQLRNLSTYLESVREQERTVIAREIHDELAQTLTALKMDLSWLDNRLPQDQKPLSAKTKSMHSLIDTTIKTVKRISAELRPGILDDLGLVAAIEWQAEEFQDRTGITCHVTVEPGDLTVDQDRSTAIFRIFQETLTNIARHARATKVAVGLTKRARRLTLRVKDNGIGITEEQIADSKSFGLIGMRERVYPWGGNVSVTGTSGKGTRVLVSVPIENEKGEK